MHFELETARKARPVRAEALHSITLTKTKVTPLFNLFRKKTQLEKLIATDGIEHATDRFAQIIICKISNREIAYKFILEELDGASKGNTASMQFAKNSGIKPALYLGALTNSTAEVDGPDGPQQLLLAMCLQISTQDLMAEFRCKVDEKIMRHFQIGKYATERDLPHTPKNQSNDFEFLDLEDPQNYTIESNGFMIKDVESGDGLAAVIKGAMFQGAVFISSTKATASLAPWQLNSSPFDDDNHFFGSSMSPKGQWSFSIRPSAPFSQILREVREQYVKQQV